MLAIGAAASIAVGGCSSSKGGGQGTSTSAPGQRLISPRGTAVQVTERTSRSHLRIRPSRRAATCSGQQHRQHLAQPDRERPRRCQQGHTGNRPWPLGPTDSYPAAGLLRAESLDRRPQGPRNGSHRPSWLAGEASPPDGQRSLPKTAAEFGTGTRAPSTMTVHCGQSDREPAAEVGSRPGADPMFNRGSSPNEARVVGDASKVPGDVVARTAT
jgi:hypothetical protein